MKEFCDECHGSGMADGQTAGGPHCPSCKGSGEKPAPAPADDPVIPPDGPGGDPGTN